MAKQWKIYSVAVRLVNNKKDLLKYMSRPTPIAHKTLGKNYATIYEITPVLTLNKSVYVGFTVLELINCLMYDFRNYFIKKHFDSELLFTDTDGIAYKIKSEDVFEDVY